MSLGPVIRSIDPADADAVAALWDEAGMTSYTLSGEAADEITAKLVAALEEYNEIFAAEVEADVEADSPAEAATSGAAS